jgi:hypothetical protein
MYRPINYYFIHYPSKQNLNGESPIFCRIVDGKKRKQVSSEIFFKAWDFIKSKGIIKDNGSKTDIRNSKLMEIKNDLENIILQYKIKDTTLTIDTICRDP